MRAKRLASQSGQILLIVLALLIVASVLVPLMVYYAQRESVWTAKQAKTTTAFHLAESGIEKGYRAVTASTVTWNDLQNGTLMSGYKFDQAYDDVAGGSYAISISSGPSTQEATIISVGKDALGREVRGIEAVYANSTLSDVAIMGGAGVDVSGNNMTIQWGSVVSQSSITPNGALYPSYWSASDIVGLDTNGATPPNCDSPNCWWWHSYDSSLPSMPTLDFMSYESSAAAEDAACAGGTGSCACAACGHFDTTSCSGSCDDTGGHTYYVTGNWSSFGGPLKGNIVILGNVTTPNGSMSGQSISAAVPQQAWMQYCNDWSYYLSTFGDTVAQSKYPNSCPGLYSSYKSASTLTYPITPVVDGLLYIGGNFTGPTGGGNSTLGYGVLMVKGTVTLNSNSHVTWYYSSAASQGIMTTTVNLSRISWQDYVTPWPSGL